MYNSIFFFYSGHWLQAPKRSTDGNYSSEQAAVNWRSKRKTDENLLPVIFLHLYWEKNFECDFEALS